jgi:hypothetical protein
MFEVSTATVSPRILRELRSGTLTTVPSRILRRPFNNEKKRKKETVNMEPTLTTCYAADDFFF